MKQFFGAFFGSIVGIVIATVIAVVIVVMVVKSSFESALKDDSEQTILKENSLLRIKFDGAISDREAINPFEEFGGMSPFGEDNGLGLNTLLKKIEDAKTNEKIKGIYLSFRNLESGFANLDELRNALLDFKKSGKFIYSYAEYFSQKEYYLASVSDKVYLNPQGMFDWRGLQMGLMFFKKTLENLDIEVEIFRHGKFKSAVEPFMLDKMSAANRYQSETFLNSIWNNILLNIAKERKMTVAELNQLANTLAIQTPEDAVGRFVDSTLYEDEVFEILKKKIGIKEKDKLKFVDISKYKIKSKEELKRKTPKVAIIYAVGSIGSGEGNDEEIGSDRLARAIREARLDTTISAIVLRVNSPGGSALASDVIWREMVISKKVKPTVVSMGNLAASGGYYISCAADRIFAQPNTITGSIGVFGILPNFQKMLENKLGITVDTVNTNRYSDVASGLRKMTEFEHAYIQASVEKVYDTFTKRVSDGRKISQAEVDSIGQGRVWSGADALRIRLVDELGGLDDAIAYAAKKAGIKDFKIVELPKQTNPLDEFLGKKESEMETKIIQRNLGATYLYLKQLKYIAGMNGVQARLPYELTIK